MKKAYETAYATFLAIGREDILTESGEISKTSNPNRTEWDNVISKK